MKIDMISVKTINPAKYNPRKDLKPGDTEYDRIKKSINEFGLVEPLVVNRDMTLIGGHQRLKVLGAAGFSEVPCVIVDLDKRREAALNVALNKLGGKWDYVKLKDLMVEIDVGDFDIEVTGFDHDELKKIFSYGDEIEVLDSSGGGLSGSNYGDSKSSSIPINILGIGGLVDRSLLEKVKKMLIEYGANEGSDNREHLHAMFERSIRV